MCIRDRNKDQHDDGEPAAEIPVAGLRKFRLYDIADQQDLAAAENVGNDEGRERRNKDHGDAAHNARYRERNPDAEQCLQKARTEISRGLDDTVVDLAPAVSYTHLVP